MLKPLLQRFGQILRDGFRIWWLSPLIPAFVVLPEFAQHIAEIQLGMFESRDAARLLADDPMRWSFGYVKIAGLLVAILATARFWGASREGNRWWNLSAIAWINVAVAAVLIVLASLPGTLFKGIVGDEGAGWINLVFAFATLPLIVLLVRGLAGDRRSNLASVFRRDWFAAVRIYGFTAALWIPLQYLHGKNHYWAFGAPEMLVWLLLVFDSLVVGLIATLAGTSLHHSSVPIRSSVATVSGDTAKAV